MCVSGGSSWSVVCVVVSNNLSSFYLNIIVFNIESYYFIYYFLIYNLFFQYTFNLINMKREYLITIIKKKCNDT